MALFYGRIIAITIGIMMAVIVPIWWKNMPDDDDD